MNQKNLLESGVRRLGCYDTEKVGTLRKYIAELELWNRRHNLVRAEGDDLIIRHILDSLAGMAVLEDLCRRLQPERSDGIKIADIGSGAGLPGIPLAIWMDWCRFYLVEKSGKRCSFLRNASALCGLQHCKVYCGPAEDSAELFDLCVFRALGDFQAYLRMLSDVTAPDGYIAAYKGKRAAVDAETAELPAGWELTAVLPLAVPFLEEERHLVVLSRTNSAG